MRISIIFFLALSQCTPTYPTWWHEIPGNTDPQEIKELIRKDYADEQAGFACGICKIDSCYRTTAMHWAAVHDTTGEIIDFLLQLHANTTSPNACGDTPLHSAVRCGNTIAINSLVRVVPQLRSHKNNYGETPLHLACRSSKHLETIESLCTEDIINEKDNRGGTPLHIATSHGCNHLVKLLVRDFGADVHARDKYGNTPLQRTNLYNEQCAQDIITFLIHECKADIDATNIDEETLLTEILSCGNLKLLNFVLSCGAHVNKQTKERTPLERSFFYGSEPATILLAHGANPKLLPAIPHMKFHILQCLQQGNVHFVDPTTGRTLVHMAVYTQDYNLFCLALDAGADPFARDCKGLRALDYLFLYHEIPRHWYEIHHHFSWFLLFADIYAPAMTQLPEDQRELLSEIKKFEELGCYKRYRANETSLIAEAMTHNLNVLLEFFLESECICDNRKDPLLDLNHALTQGNIPAVKILYKSPQIKHLLDSCNLTRRKAMCTAIQSGTCDLVQFLVDNLEESLNPIGTAKPDVSSEIPLHVAVAASNQEMLALLLRYPINVDIQPLSLNVTALHIAAFKNNLDAVNMLLQAHANPNLTEWKGRKPSDCTKDLTIRTILQEAESRW